MYRVKIEPPPTPPKKTVSFAALLEQEELMFSGHTVAECFSVLYYCLHARALKKTCDIFKKDCRLA